MVSEVIEISSLLSLQVQSKLKVSIPRKSLFLCNQSGRSSPLSRLCLHWDMTAGRHQVSES